MKFLRVLSINQWLKNILIFIPAVFATVAWNTDLILELTLAFFGFSLIASAVYVHNDITDKKLDAQHPEKKKRSIASGEISVYNARILQLTLIVTGTALLFLISNKAFILGVAYLIINLLYSQVLKQIPLIDLIPIISGYFIRLLIGEEIANAPLSIWILIMVGLLATYLVLMKRQGDVQLFQSSGVEHRKTVVFYSKMHLPVVTLTLIHAIILVYAAYIHFVFSKYPDTFSYLPYLTIPLCYVAIFSYHIRAQKRIQKDPISTLLTNFWSLLFVGISFLLLVVTLYPVFG
ncbi:MAG: UbiA family prenyltransferase [Fluviicola sp.]